MGSVAGTSVGLEREKTKSAFGWAGVGGWGEGVVVCAVDVAEHTLADGCLDGRYALGEMSEFR